MFSEVSRRMALLQFMWSHDSHLMRQLSRRRGWRGVDSGTHKEDYSRLSCEIHSLNVMVQPRAWGFLSQSFKFPDMFISFEFQNGPTQNKALLHLCFRGFSWDPRSFLAVSWVRHSAPLLSLGSWKRDLEWPAVPACDWLSAELLCASGTHPDVSGLRWALEGKRVTPVLEVSQT